MNEATGAPRSDDELLDSVARLWEKIDPPPEDLADGVLARLAAQDLEYELLTLVESDEALAGVRSATMLRAPDETGTWSLEYLGPGFRVQLRISRRGRQARLDGWVSPPQPMTVMLSSVLRKGSVLEAQVSDSGRFEFPVAPAGACRMTFVTETGGRPQATPPFWI
ncbi:hypothetical protein [Nocardioides pocheonensis]|jgi:hypothetical protein|uniref:Carboxypeptidase regulatory-like domain-containing protein n=1 Tax=Nocardioides pocheonensis TaxID=661485 RepID=A0A3N0GM83_9ACTN|nr:hypothetical protein [Nocardioides pocheonensis]RNM13567.1 hypothetical protein EFL26_11190 [Nocardioides pocheonensis]